MFFVSFSVFISLSLVCDFTVAEIRAGKNANSKKAKSDTFIIVAMDGMFWKTLKDNLTGTPNLDFVAETGVKADAIRTVTPTKTWPNHISLLTGLYPESHGIVSNQFWDPVYKQKFVYDYDCTNYDPKFFNKSEPIWLTFQKQGGRSGVYFWPGYGGYKERPTYYEEEICSPGVNCSDPATLVNKTKHCVVNYSEPFQSRIDKVMGWLKSDKPPQFVALYIDEPDWKGHSFGTNSTQYLNMTSQVDRDAVGYLMERLRAEEMLDSVNLVFVSDHGFVDIASPEKREILLNNYIDPTSYRLIEDGAFGHIWPNEGKLKEIYINLTKAAKNQPFMVYKKEDIPDNLHIKKNRRFPPIWVQPDPGWMVFQTFYPMNYSVFGQHGYPSNIKDMWSIFYARGPAFREGFKSETFNSVDLYPLMCHLIGMEPLPNNGSFDRVKIMLKEFASYIGAGQERATLDLVSLLLLLGSLLFTDFI